MDRPVLEFVVVAEPGKNAALRAVLEALAALTAHAASSVMTEDGRTLDWTHDGALYRARLADDASNGFDDLDGCPCVLLRLDATESVVRTHLLPDENPMLALTIEDVLGREGRAFEVQGAPDDSPDVSDVLAIPAFPPFLAAGAAFPDTDPASSSALRGLRPAGSTRCVPWRRRERTFDVSTDSARRAGTVCPRCVSTRTTRRKRNEDDSTARALAARNEA